MLETLRTHGYPDEYLIARLKGRRTFLVSDWDALLAAETPELPSKYGTQQQERPEEAISRAFHKELLWVYGQMDGRLREVFTPVFLYFELKTIFSCVRYKSRKGTEEAIRNALAYSNLSSRVKSVLVEADSSDTAMQGVLKGFSTFDRIAFRVLDSSRFEGKFEEAERHLTEKYLEQSARLAAHPNLRSFFRYLVDMRNIITAYKHMRWDISKGISYVHGGSIDIDSLSRANDKTDLSALVQKLTGLKYEGELETLLLKGLLRLTARGARSGSSEAFVSDYLLRCYVEARNLSIILAGKNIDRERLKEEVVF